MGFTDIKVNFILGCIFFHMPGKFVKGIGEAWGTANSAVNNRGGYIKELGCQINAGLGGFIFIVAPDGKFLYVSEGTSPLLGLSQVDLPGNPIYDYISPSDHEEMAAILRGHPHPSFLQEIPVNDGIYSDNRMSSWPSRYRIPCPDFTHMDLRHTKGESEIPVSFVIRMKCILAKRSAGLVSNSFKKLLLKIMVKCKKCEQWAHSSYAGIVNESQFVCNFC